MKALILAAGFGTRLKPYTDHTPKALFPFRGRPLLDRIIDDLKRAGCREILVNTHHLGNRIKRHITEQRYDIPVRIRHEPRILGTGGAIKNAGDFIGDQPFMVINSDIVTDIDLASVYRFHTRHSHPATLVLLDHPAFNTVRVTGDHFIAGFDGVVPQTGKLPGRKLAFTGIQVLNPSCLDFIPSGTFSSSITAYAKMIASGLKIKAYMADSCHWKDIGMPERYKSAVIEAMAAAAFKKAFPGMSTEKITRSRLKGDGSDRKWYRLSAEDRSLILVDHGIREKLSTCEIDAFVGIGRHLFSKGVPVPEIILHDTFSGVVFLEDLGTVHFQDFIHSAPNPGFMVSGYERVIDEMIRMSAAGAEGFDPAWAYQTPRYDKDFILDYECRYFVDSFLNGYLGIGAHFEDFADEFTTLADRAVSCSLDGFMHRDFQSRNIMVKNRRFYFIDFQGGRTGPLQYDLASLLLDPYVALPPDIRTHLLDYCVKKLQSTQRFDKDKFLTGFQCCALTRNLQILGAFGYLSRVKGKTGFEKYIPAALKSLKQQVSVFDTGEFQLLKKIVDKL